MSIFEIVMLLCFGAAWPFSIYKTQKAMSNNGKSVIFLFIIMAGYISGIIHKLIYSFDVVIYLYALNFLMVSTDMVLWFRNEKLSKQEGNNCQ